MVSNLKVDKIQSVAGTTTAMTIDSVGRVGQPNKPSFHVATTAIQDASLTINWNVEIFDIGNNFNTGTNKFVAPIAGIYWFNCSALQAGNGAQMTISLRKNSSTTGRFITRTDGDSGEHHSCSVSGLYNLVAGDTVEVYLEAGRIYGDSGYFSNFTGFLIG